MRDAVAKQGRDPTLVHPRCPTDLIVDHSLQIDYSKWRVCITKRKPGVDELKSGPNLVPVSRGLLLLLVVTNYRPSCGLWFPPVPSRTLQTRVVGPVLPRARLHPDPHLPNTYPEGVGPPGAPAARQPAATLQQQRRSSRLRTHPSSAPSTSNPSTSESTLLLLLNLLTR